MNTIKCLKCFSPLNSDNWYGSQRKRGSKYCKKCFLKMASNWAKQNRVRCNLNERKCRVKRKFGITIEQYDQMFQGQFGVCAICKNPEKSKNQYGIKRLAIDHDHKTGKVRGLLCASCNGLLGLAKDNVDTLLKAVNYLKETQT